MSRIRTRFAETHTLPFSEQIPNSEKTYLLETPLAKRLFKFIKRAALMHLLGQSKRELRVIPLYSKKVLWINLSAPSIGDSLMDLSSRVLLSHKEIHLLTADKNASIYTKDSVFSKVYTNPSAIKERYDVFILDSYSTRSILSKCKVSIRAKFVGMYGHYNGPEVNRVLFSWHRMNQLLRLPASKKWINKHAKSSITPSKTDTPERPYIALSVGGEWPYRTYLNWKPIIEYISTEMKLPIALIGSPNALKFSKELEINKYVKTYIGKLSFSQTAHIIQNSDLFVGADGGLMHAALAVGKKSVALLAKLNHEILFTVAASPNYLYDSADVNNITPDAIIQEIRRSFA